MMLLFHVDANKYIRAADAFSNNPFKGCIMELYDEWLASGVHQYTRAGNMKHAIWLLLGFKKHGLNLIKNLSSDYLNHVR